MAKAPSRPTLALSLLRHAKAARLAADGSDISRPLTERGQRDADAMGAHIAASKLPPDLVLCSSSVRTLETLERVLAHFTVKPKVSPLDTLYLAGALVLLKRLHAVPPKSSHVMIIGHNPGLHALALDLVAGGPQDKIAELGRKLPTSGLVVVEFALAGWGEVVAGTGTLAAFVTPGELG